MPSQQPKSPFDLKKSQILCAISTHTSSDYKDKSPKGTIDAEIIELIDEINAFDGFVTTSSCAGRVSVFVEGRKGGAVVGSRDGNANVDSGGGETKDDREDHEDEMEQIKVAEGNQPSDSQPRPAATPTPKTTFSAKGLKQPISTGPGGKGGGHWLYTSHTRIPNQHLTSPDPLHLQSLFNLRPQERSALSLLEPPGPNIRLIKLNFSPLILHVLCRDLKSAKGLLAAAIGSGFRESGLQSYGVSGEERGVMLGIRTAGVGFETVVGVVDESKMSGDEVDRCAVDETYLRMCVGVCNERFRWNDVRRERLRKELRNLRESEERERKKEVEWEDKDVRRERRRLAGLRVREGTQWKERRDEEQDGKGSEDDVLEGGLFLDQH